MVRGPCRTLGDHWDAPISLGREERKVPGSCTFSSESILALPGPFLQEMFNTRKSETTDSGHPYGTFRGQTAKSLKNYIKICDIHPAPSIPLFSREQRLGWWSFGRTHSKVLLPMGH